MVMPARMGRVKVAEAVLPTESVAVMPKVGLPVAVGLPLNTPAEVRDRPAGSVEPLLRA